MVPEKEEVDTQHNHIRKERKKWDKMIPMVASPTAIQMRLINLWWVAESSVGWHFHTFYVLATFSSR
jgi:hypothetical protein